MKEYTNICGAVRMNQMKNDENESKIKSWFKRRIASYNTIKKRDKIFLLIALIGILIILIWALIKLI